jgi:hypothetical protein
MDALTCDVRKSKGKNFGKCEIGELGETRQSVYYWCENCGVMVKEGEFGGRSVWIPKFDNQTGGPA